MELPLSGQPLTITAAYCDEIQLSSDDPNLSSVFFRDCVIQSLVLESEAEAEKLPYFQNCIIGFLQRRTSASDLPDGHFEGCAFEEFAEWTITTSAFMHLDVAPGLRVLLSILKKLFLQAGRGRQASSFYRGIDQRARHFVPEVLQLISSEGLAIETKIAGKSIWIPVRRESARARGILASPNASSDRLVERCRSLT
jgi:hypothetical protein